MPAVKRWAPGDQSRGFAERQAESPVRAVHRRGRSCDRHQRGEGPFNGLEEPAEALSPLHGFPGRAARRRVYAAIAPQAGSDSGAGHQGHAAKSKMGRQMGTKLKVYRGDKHPHQAQTPVAMEIK